LLLPVVIPESEATPPVEESSMLSEKGDLVAAASEASTFVPFSSTFNRAHTTQTDPIAAVVPEIKPGDDHVDISLIARAGPLASSVKFKPRKPPKPVVLATPADDPPIFIVNTTSSPVKSQAAQAVSQADSESDSESANVFFKHIAKTKSKPKRAKGGRGRKADNAVKVGNTVKANKAVKASKTKTGQAVKQSKANGKMMEVPCDEEGSRCKPTEDEDKDDHEEKQEEEQLLYSKKGKVKRVRLAKVLKVKVKKIESMARVFPCSYGDVLSFNRIRLYARKTPQGLIGITLKQVEKRVVISSLAADYANPAGLRIGDTLLSVNSLDARYAKCRAVLAALIGPKDEIAAGNRSRGSSGSGLEGQSGTALRNAICEGMICVVFARCADPPALPPIPIPNPMLSHAMLEVTM
jgi:hypothetical protein